jgi:hypothetical protein
MNINAPKQEVINTEVQEANGQPMTPEIYFDAIDSYKDFINKMKFKLKELIDEGTMSEVVATRILDEFSYNAFQQIVKVNYR